uniref:Uncharacterized protein n=1 Tax=Rhizophora mucronata TaxID=61149 RepID=A0A2P2QYL7_RHIMU
MWFYGMYCLRLMGSWII